MLTFKKKLDTKVKHTVPISQLTWDVVESNEMAVECMKDLPYNKMFYDIDFKLSPSKDEMKEMSMEKDDFLRLKDSFFRLLEVNSVKHNFMYTKFASREWRSSVEGKISTHIVFRNKYISRGYRPERTYLNRHFLSTVLDGATENIELWLGSIDLSPYASSVESDNVFRIAGKGDRSGKKTHHYPISLDDPVSWYLLTPTEKFNPDNDVLTLYSEINLQKKEKEEKKEQENPKKARGRPKKLEVSAIPNDILEKMFRALDAEKRAYKHEDWTRTMLLCKTLLGDEGLDVFLELSEASSYEDFDEKDCASAYERAVPNGDLTEGTLIYWLKEDNPDELSELLRQSGHAGRDGYDLVYYKSYSVEFMKDLISLLNKDTLTITRDPTGQIWIKQVLDLNYTNCWRPVHKLDLSYHLLPRLNLLKIAVMERNDQEVELTLVNKNLDFLQDRIFKHFSDFIQVKPDFDSMFQSNLRKLCFSNGVLDLTTNRFSSWKMNPTVHTKVVIPYKYELLRESEEKPLIDANIVFLKSLFGEEKVDDDLTSPYRWEVPLKRLARILAGENDKLWHLFQSLRNGAKSAFLSILEEALPGYVQTFNSGMIMTQKLSMKGDPSRELSPWISFVNTGCRFAYCQEAQETESHSNAQYINSSVLKLLNGRDPLRARKMYQDDSSAQTVTHQMTVGICCNKPPQATSPDVFETCCVNKFIRQFLRPDKLQEYKDNGLYIENVHFLADPSKQEVVKKNRLQWVKLIAKYYSAELYPVDRVGSNGDMRDEESKSDMTESEELLLLLKSHFEKDNESHISTLQLSRFCSDHTTQFKRTDVISKLEAMGAKYSKHIQKTRRGYRGLKYIPCKDCECENSPQEDE